jgi:N-sulfoglucosamine sulfohydrolase
MRLNQIIPVSLFLTGILTKGNAQDRPNILCIVCEDISPYLSCYGDPVAKTPNLDRFAAEGIRFTHMYTTVGVSAPSRAALITGMYPTAIGANHMRNTSGGMPAGIDPYEVVLPEGVKCYTEFLREAGYYCTNNDKTDYQFASPLTAWDENGKEAHWKHKPPDKPFFSIFNLFVTHESQIWQRGSMPLLVDPQKVPLPSYFPDDPIIRHDVAVMYSNIYEMDKQVQHLIDEVKEAGLLENTIVIFYSDNGGPLPRQKRAIYESGTLVPFMVRFPDGFRKGEVEDRLCSFIDIPATILSLAEIKPPKYMHGRAFLGKYQTKNREYIFGARNRMDEQIDKQGYVRDAKYRYIYNYLPEKPNYMPVQYRLQMPMMRRMLELYEHDSLNEVQKIWFEALRETEEFYDVENDPDEINNLIHNPAYKKEIDRLRSVYNKWQRDYNELWKLPEAESRELFFPNGNQQVVSTPTIIQTSGGVVFKCGTKGVSFAYQINGKGNSDNHWFLYSKPVRVKKGDMITVIAVRAGFRNSEKVEYQYQ